MKWGAMTCSDKHAQQVSYGPKEVSIEKQIQRLHNEKWSVLVWFMAAKLKLIVARQSLMWSERQFLLANSTPKLCSVNGSWQQWQLTIALLVSWIWIPVCHNGVLVIAAHSCMHVVLLPFALSVAPDECYPCIAIRGWQLCLGENPADLVLDPHFAPREAAYIILTQGIKVAATNPILSHKYLINLSIRNTKQPPLHASILQKFFCGKSPPVSHLSCSE